MSYPIRYSAAGTKIVETDPAGPLVEYADYAILEAENARLKAEVERLRKHRNTLIELLDKAIEDLNAAKEGKQP